jgi:hypothetical protein
LLNEAVPITDNGRRRKITKREAVIKQFVIKSASSDARSLKILLDLMLKPRSAGAVFCRLAPGRGPHEEGPGAAGFRRLRATLF